MKGKSLGLVSKAIPVSWKPCIITFIGPVGVGKSTQIELLKHYLRSRDVRVVETFIKSRHFFVDILNKSLVLLGLGERISYQDGSYRIQPRRDVVKRFFPLWRVLDSLVITIKFFFFVYMPFCLGSTILVEEGLLMTLQDYLMLFSSTFERERKVPPLIPLLFSWVANKNHVDIVLNAADEELARRRKFRTYGQNELPEYISLQRSWIRLLDRVSLLNTIFIDTNGESLRSVHGKIVVALEEHMQRSIA